MFVPETHQTANNNLCRLSVCFWWFALLVDGFTSHFVCLAVYEFPNTKIYRTEHARQKYC